MSDYLHIILHLAKYINFPDRLAYVYLKELHSKEFPSSLYINASILPVIMHMLPIPIHIFKTWERANYVSLDYCVKVG